MAPRNRRNHTDPLVALEAEIGSLFDDSTFSPDLTQAGLRITNAIHQHLRTSLAYGAGVVVATSADLADLLVHHIAGTMALKGTYTALARAIDAGQILTELPAGTVYETYAALEHAAGIQQMVAAELNDAFTALQAATG